MLHPHDITALIRDTEAHERALFTFVPPEAASFESKSRKSLYPNDGEQRAQAKPHFGLKSTTAVGRILGRAIVENIRRRDRDGEGGKHELDVEALLRGAEKLCTI